MIDTYKELVSNQFEATFCTLSAGVDHCPDSRWQAPVGNLKFCQVAFHALFYADLFLGPDVKSIRQQAFHHDHAAVFDDYEELEDRVQRAVYEKPFITKYLQHCRSKASQVIAAESAQSLQQSSGFDWLEFSRAELHVYNIRHLHHHAAQLSLRLRIDTGDGVSWVYSGWHET